MYQVPSKLLDLWEFVGPGILESDVSWNLMYQVPSKLSDLWEFVGPGILESDVSSSVKALGSLGNRGEAVTQPLAQRHMSGGSQLPIA